MLPLAAIAGAAARLEDRPTPRRAVIVVTDGLDTASTKTVADVSAAASAIDVPVYVIVVTTPANHPTKGIAPLQNDGEPIATRLANLAAWTGGDMLIASTPAETSLIARRLVVELRRLRRWLEAGRRLRAHGGRRRVVCAARQIRPTFGHGLCGKYTEGSRSIANPS